MKTARRLALVVAFATFGSPHARGSDVRMIANPSIKAETISAAEIRSVFLEERNSLNDGTHVEPVLSKNGVAHTSFVERYLGVNENDLQTYYRALVFTGRGSMPKALASDADVIAYVARTRGAIGYVNEGTNTEGVKTLTIEEAPAGGERRLLERVEPEYPQTLKDLGIGGTVRLRVAISPRGTVEAVDLLGGNPILGDAAAAAIRKWTYAPARSRTIIDVRIRF